METKFRYKVYCETDLKWEHFETVNPLEVCPVNSAHTIKADSLSISEGVQQKDYKYLRDQFKEYIKTLSILNPKTVNDGFDQSSTAEKILCCEHKIGSHSQRVAVVTLANVVSFGVQYKSRTGKSREIRMIYAVALLHNYLPNNAPTVLDEARNPILDYYIFGREGTAQGDQEGITDYFNGLGSYSGAGLINKSWTPEGGLTMQQLITNTEDIILNGNY